LRNTKKTQDSWSPGEDSNWESQKYVLAQSHTLYNIGFRVYR